MTGRLVRLTFCLRSTFKMYGFMNPGHCHVGMLQKIPKRRDPILRLPHEWSIPLSIRVASHQKVDPFLHTVHAYSERNTYSRFGSMFDSIQISSAVQPNSSTHKDQIMYSPVRWTRVLPPFIQVISDHLNPNPLIIRKQLSPCVR